MKIQSANNSRTFQSNFAPGNILQRSFNVAIRNRDAEFYNALIGILNNGKKDIIDFKPEMMSKNAYQGMTLYINDEPTLNVTSKYIVTDRIKLYMAHDTIHLIKLFASLTKVLNNKYITDVGTKLNKLESEIFKQKK